MQKGEALGKEVISIRNGLKLDPIVKTETFQHVISIDIQGSDYYSGEKWLLVKMTKPKAGLELLQLQDSSLRFTEKGEIWGMGARSMNLVSRSLV